MLIDMVSEQTRPFYQMGTLMTMDKIPKEEFRSFIEAKFVKSGRRISPAAEALSIILRGQEPAYLTIWETLTLHQRKTVKAGSGKPPPKGKGAPALSRPLFTTISVIITL
ncbi:hypothetical protein ES703_99623 [subsurface metagenome]